MSYVLWNIDVGEIVIQFLDTKCVQDIICFKMFYM